MPSPEFDRLLAIQAELTDLLHSEPEPDDLRRRWAEINPFPTAADVAVEQVDADGVNAELLTPPEAAPGRLLIYFHQGAFVMGSAAEFRGPIGEIARAAGVQALVPDYRLAPGDPFPAGLEDCVAAYRWALANGYESAAIAFAGDSAGGNLAVTTLLAARAEGLPLPAASVSLSAWHDMESVGETFATNAGSDPLITRGANLEMAAAYLGPAGDPRNPLANPLFADLAGLPPMFLRSGSREVLLSDAERLANRLEQAGTEVDWRPAEGMVHMWYLYVDFLPEARRTLLETAAFLRAHLA
jgi:monoterpene epsilon-lactone hydrolase